MGVFVYFPLEFPPPEHRAFYHKHFTNATRDTKHFVQKVCFGV
jgi:hypothetical protein